MINILKFTTLRKNKKNILKSGDSDYYQECNIIFLI